MQNLAINNLNFDISNELFLDEEIARNDYEPKTLLQTINQAEFLEESSLLNFDLTNHKVYKIAKELAVGIDNNDIERLKNLKEKYSNSSDYIKAKNYLNKKCKELWDINNKKKRFKKVPTKAMATIGITNLPDLSDLLDSAIRLYENENNDIVAKRINSIIENKNFNYNIEDVLNYLEFSYKKYHHRCNLITFEYIAKKTNFNYKKLKRIGIDKKEFIKIIKKQGLKFKIKFYFSLLCRIYLHI